MARTPRNIAGQTFGLLTALAPQGKQGRRTLWACRCACGKPHTVSLSNLTCGVVKSCGCTTRTCGGVAGRAARRTYASYNAMLRRCTDPSYHKYLDYGGAGVSVFFDWMPPRGFPAFLRDMGPRPEGKTLDRIDNDKGYDPWNCRWADSHTQRMNQRRMIAAANNRENM